MHSCECLRKMWIVLIAVLLVGAHSASAQEANAERAGAETVKLATPTGIASTAAEASIADVLVEITWPREGLRGVYVDRPFELRITPRDRDANPIDTLLRVRLTARFPGEFDAASRGYFEHEFEIRGATTIMLVPNFERNNGSEQQWLLVYCESAPDLIGQSDPFSVLPHAPDAFALTYPPARHEFTVLGSGDWNTGDFRWEQPSPADPYSAMRQKAADSIRWSDSVRYTFVITNEHAAPIFRSLSDNAGTLPMKTLANSQMITILRTQCKRCIQVNLQWYVEASDGDFVTLSTPAKSEFSLRWESSGDAVYPVTDAMNFTLEANSPNPFQSSTTIPFQLSRAGTVRLGIVNILGETMRVLAEGELSPGRHVRTLDAAGLAPGLYFARLTTVSGSQTRAMLLLQ